MRRIFGGRSCCHGVYLPNRPPRELLLWSEDVYLAELGWSSHMKIDRSCRLRLQTLPMYRYLIFVRLPYCRFALSIWLSYKIASIYRIYNIHALGYKNSSVTFVCAYHCISIQLKPNYCVFFFSHPRKVNMTVEIGAWDAMGIRNGYKSETIANNQLFINIKYDNAIDASFMRESLTTYVTSTRQNFNMRIHRRVRVRARKLKSFFSSFIFRNE